MSKIENTVEQDIEYGYEELANAIIIQAAKDYRSALKRLKKNPENKKAATMKRECERFFHSPWYTMLTDVNPNYILNRIREEE